MCGLFNFHLWRIYQWKKFCQSRIIDRWNVINIPVYEIKAHISATFRPLCEHNDYMLPPSHDVTIMWLMFYLDTIWPETAWSMAELSTITSVCFLLFRQHLLSFTIVFIFFISAFVWDLVLIPYISWVASCCQKEGFIWIISCLWKTTGNNKVIGACGDVTVWRSKRGSE